MSTSLVHTYIAVKMLLVCVTIFVHCPICVKNVCIPYVIYCYIRQRTTIICSGTRIKSVLLCIRHYILYQVLAVALMTLLRVVL
jgi:hypothetical protein